MAAVLLIVGAAVFLFLRGGSDAPQFAVPTTATSAVTATTVTAATTTVTVAEPEPATTSSTTTATTVTATTAATVAEPDEPAPTTTGITVPSVTVPMPEPVDWWAYNAALEWPVTDRDRLSVEADLYPPRVIPDAVGVARRVEAFWSWYMTEGHSQGAALDLSDRPELAGDAVGQLTYGHHRFWQQRLPVWWEVWNREFDKAREAQRNKLIYLDSLGELNQVVRIIRMPPTLLYNPAEETTVWRYWGPIIRPAPDPTAPRRFGERLPDDLGGACGPESTAPGDPFGIVDWDCVHLGPAEETALGDWDASWYYDIPHEHAAWYVYTPAGPVRYDPRRPRRPHQRARRNCR